VPEAEPGAPREAQLRGPGEAPETAARIAVWLGRQGLPAAKRSVVACLARGWIYTGGGQLPYVALFARGVPSRSAVDKAIARGDAVEVLTVRACTMLVGAGDVPLALAAGRVAFRARLAAAKLPVTPRELATLEAAILHALDDGPRGTTELRTILGGAIRDLGEAGRRKGFGSTLPIALDALHVAGRIKRISATGRLDSSHFRYQRWDPAPAMIELDRAAIARRFLAWAAPASAKDLAWWAGLTASDARDAAAAAGEPAPPRVRKPDGSIVFLPFRDNYTHLRRDLAPLLDARDAAVPVLDWQRGTVPLGRAQSLHQHAIVIDGRVAGVWDFDADAQRLVWATFARATPALRDAAARTADFVRDELGDLRLYALDNAANRAHRLAYLRGAKYRGTA